MKVKIQNITLLILYISQAIIFLVHGIEGGKAVGAGLACVEAIILLFSSRSFKGTVFFKIFFGLNIGCLLINLMMTLIYMPPMKNGLPLSIFIVSLLITLNLIVKLVLDIIIKEE